MKRLAIVGTHPKTRDQGPFDNLDYDIWVFNEAPQAEWCKRWTACFQLHKPEIYTSPNNMVDTTHWNWLQQDHGIDKTIYLQEMDTRIPNGMRFPLDEIKQSIPSAQYGQFTSTVSMALALGLYMGYETIELWGVDLSSNTEYAYQQMGFVFWVGVASAMLGDKFKLHCGLQHFSTRLYGYDGDTQIDRNYFSDRVEFFRGELKRYDWEFAKLKTRLTEALDKAQSDKFMDLIVEAQEIAMNVGEAQGSLQEAMNYANRDDPISRQQFERRGAIAQAEAQKNQTLMDHTHGEMTYVFNAWMRTMNPQALSQLKMFYINMLNHAVITGGNLGVMHESARYMNEYDQRVQAAGGERTLKALGVA